MVKYRYDAWGNLLYGTPSTHCIASDYNPFIYKGYMYDEETGWYYLQSRYYIPSMCRFLSPDEFDYVDTETIGGLNLYAYCANNPINCADYNDHSLEWLSIAGKIITGITAVVTGALVIASGVALAPMLIVAGVTVLAGLLTIVNGAAEIQQSINGKNFIRDGVFNGNQNAYNLYSVITEAVAVIGSMICGGWLKNNALQIKTNKALRKYNVKSKHFPEDTRHWNKFTTNNQKYLRKLGNKALKYTPKSQWIQNSSDSYKIIYEYGRVIGTKGETSIVLVFTDLGKIITLFPY